MLGGLGWAILDGLGDMLNIDDFSIGKIGDGAWQFQHAMVSTGAQLHPLDRNFQ
jgi:hypothetical protein